MLTIPCTHLEEMVPPGWAAAPIIPVPPMHGFTVEKLIDCRLAACNLNDVTYGSLVKKPLKGKVADVPNHGLPAAPLGA